MKKSIVLVAVFLSNLVTAQEFQGKAEYFSKIIIKPNTKEVKTKEDEELNKLVEEAMKKASESRYTLTFNKQECLYEKNQELEKPSGENGMAIAISFSSEGNKYINLKDKTVLIEDEIFGKEFLRTDELVSYNWRFLDETKKIGEYNCFKAEAIIPVTDEEKQQYADFLKQKVKNKTSGLFDMPEPKDKKVVAWYTPEIPVSFGPNNYWGLPGLILEINEDEVVILCSKVTLNTKETTKIKIPSKGKKITTKEFEKLQKEKYDSMKNEDGAIIIKQER